MRRLILCCIVAAVAPPAHAADGPAPDVPELAPLGKWEGSWDTLMTIKPNATYPKGREVKATSRCEWVLDGRYLGQSWSAPAVDGFPGFSGSTMMTYDPARRSYRNWGFTSYGMPVEAAGVWDGPRQTMTWTTVGAEGSETTVTKATFPEDGSEVFSIVTKNRAGAIISEVSGKNSRSKAK